MNTSPTDSSHDDFNGVSNTDLSPEEISEKLKGYYLVRSYASDAGPYDVISDLPEEEGQKIAVKNDPVRGADNYQQRLRTENWLRENAESTGVMMDKATPAYFAFTNDPDFIIEHTRQNAPHKEIIVLPADQVDLSNWSFTMDDHFFANFDDNEGGDAIPSHAEPHPLHGHVLNAEQLVQALETYGYPDDPYKNNFEAQMWASELTLLEQSPQQDIVLRAVEAGDVDAIQTLFEQEAAHNGVSFDEDSPYHPANAAIAVVNASLNTEDINNGWIAFAGDTPAGIITTPQGLSGGLFVAEEFRGRGIGQALVQQREHYFKDDLGLTEIERPVRADNEASIKLHTEKLGYQFSQASQELLNDNPNPPGETVLHLVKTL